MGGPSTTLFLRNLPVELVRATKAAAARRGQTLTTFVAEALSRFLAIDDEPHELDHDLERDIAWYRQNRRVLLRRYRGEYAAIIDANVVDHHRDFQVLATRVFRRFGNRTIYMPRVQPGERTVRIRSPRKLQP